MVSRGELAEQFSNFGIELADDVLEKCWEVCVEAGVGEEEFLETWMAYSVSRLSGADPTVELVAQMDRDEYGKKSGIHNRNTPSTPAGRGKKGGGDLIIYDPSSRNTPSSKLDVDLLETYGGTPKVRRGGSEGKRAGAERTPSRGQYRNGNALGEKPSQVTVPPRGTFSPASYSPSTATQSVAYSGRSNAGQVLCSHNVSEAADWEWEGGSDSFHPSLEELNDRPSGNLRYMCDFVGEVAELLEAHLRLMEKCLNEEAGLEPWVPEPLDMPLRSSQNYLGRICSDGRLNAESILLEGAIDSTVSGKPIRVDVSGMSSEEGGPKEPYALFPGQVVVVNGQNHKGQKLFVQEVYSKGSAPLPSKAPAITTETGPLHVMVGTGPFTQLDTLSYEPLQDLMVLVRKLRPHVLILIGPFLEFAHSHLSGDGGCQLAETFENYFDRMVDEMMGQLQGLTTQVVLVSSARDVHAHAVYPTPAYAFPTGGRASQYLGSGSDGTKRPRLILAPDPCLLDISGVVIGVTATDILMHLGREEMAGAGHKIDRLGRLSRHLIHQRNFYPLYPPALGVNMDMKLWSQMCTWPVTPHILILPSDLRGFIKDVEGCIVMNPERLTKGVVGGSFAKFEVKSLSSWEPSLLSNVRAQVVKI